MATKVRLCPKCPPHPYQDGKYGDKKRVMNSMLSDKDYEEWRCTVCSAEHRVNKVKEE